ncbi:MAG: GAF domain-containing protein [Desulfonauticus sp.]|nr:GAF domain-containing protein [Desulfonauticus sp.]
MDFLDKLISVGIAINSVVDLEELLDLILQKARDLSGADAGSIYLVKDKELVFFAAQNDTLEKRLGKEEVKNLFRNFSLSLDKSSVAGYVAVTGEVLNIENVYENSQHDFWAHKQWDRANNYRSKSMLVFPLTTPKQEVVGVIQLINAKENGQIVPFKQSFVNIMPYFAAQAAVAIVNARLYHEVEASHLDTVFRLGVAAEYRDKETAFHIKRVAKMAVVFGQELGFSKQALHNLYWSVAMHDVGKLGVPDSILNKPGPLTDQERAIMQQHTLIGGYILRNARSELLQDAQIVALTHHEKYDGTGYPAQLKGESIPLIGRIAGIVDVFDALSSVRVYKPPFSEEKVRKIMLEGKGTHFDPDLIDILLENWDKFWDIRQKYQDGQKISEKHWVPQRLCWEELWQEIKQNQANWTPKVKNSDLVKW